MKFTYKARTKDGKTISGTAEASDKEALVGSLSKQGVKPIYIHEGDGGKKGTGKRGGLFKPKVKTRDLVVFTRQLSTMVSAGVPLPRSLATLGEQAENKYFQGIVGAIGRDIESGISLGDAFGKH